MILLFAEIYIFRITNEIFSKYYKVKKIQIRQKGIFIIKDTQDVLI